MAQNEPQRKDTPPGPSPNSSSLLFEYQCRSGKFIRLANRIESKKKSIRQRESNRIESKLFCPNWNALAKWSNFSGFSHLPLLTYSCNLAARQLLGININKVDDRFFAEVFSIIIEISEHDMLIPFSVFSRRSL